jgi:hypothetical protein
LTLPRDLAYPEIVDDEESCSAPPLPVRMITVEDLYPVIFELHHNVSERDAIITTLKEENLAQDEVIGGLRHEVRDLNLSLNKTGDDLAAANRKISYITQQARKQYDDFVHDRQLFQQLVARVQAAARFRTLVFTILLLIASAIGVAQVYGKMPERLQYVREVKIVQEVPVEVFIKELVPAPFEVVREKIVEVRKETIVEREVEKIVEVDKVVERVVEVTK